MWKRQLLVMVAFLFIEAVAWGRARIPADEMPLGAFLTFNRQHVTLTDSLRRDLHDSLGFQFVYLSGLYDTCGEGTVRTFYQDSLYSVFRMLNTGDTLLSRIYQEYEKSHYAKIEAEDDSHTVRFLYKRGSSVDGWFTPDRCSPGDSLVVMDNLWYGCADTVRFIDESYAPLYTPALRIWANRDSLGSNDTLAILKIYSNKNAACGWCNDSISRHNYLYLSYPITANMLAQDTSELTFAPFFFTNCGSIITFTLVSKCHTPFKIDWLKVYDRYGKWCVEENRYDQSIVNYVTQGWCDTMILSWYLRDEPTFDQIMPLAHISNVIKHASDSAFGDTTYCVTASLGDWLHIYQMRSMIEYDYPPSIWPDIYPFYAKEDHNTLYACYGINGVNWGLQTELNSSIVRTCDSIRLAINNQPTDWWLIPQTWDEYIFGRGYTQRFPTKSELKCELYMAMSYGVKGFVFYNYLGDSSANIVIHCIRGANPNYTRTSLWYALHEDIVPYIKAIDETYMGLTLDTSVVLQGGNSSGIGYILSIDTIPGSSINNPDAGWFQIGLYDSSGNRYFMIVNRACSQGPEDPTEAPPITAVLHLDTSMFNSSALIIDIAKSVNHDTANHTWTAVPETTYSGALGGSIPFTITLRAGEGRLFKVVPWDEIPLETGLSQPGFVYQGGLNAAGAFAVDSGDTFKLRGPAVINASPSQTASIYIGGDLSAIGYESDSIIFKCDSMYGWDGFAFGTNSSGEFEYCLIVNANMGIYMGTGSEVNTSHCLIDTIATNGIENNRGILTVDNCYFRHNFYKGINSYAGVATIDSSYFQNCWRYGIYINSHPTGTYDSTVVTNCKIERTLSPYPDSSQYGIYVSGNAKIRLANNLIRNTGQGGIRLSASTALVNYDTVRYNLTGNGILCENSAIATLQYCVLDSIYRGIYTTANTNCYTRWTRFKNQSYGVYTYGLPNLGDSREAGNNDFAGCSSWYIRRITFVNPPPRLYAINNYYGPGIPNPNKFSDSVVYIPYLPTSPFLNPKINPATDIPRDYDLYSNYPNPFNPQTAISFNLIEPAQTRVLIYNVLGQKIKTLVNEYLSPGQYSYIWDGRTDIGGEAASGVYLYRIESGSFIQTKKMTLIR